MVVRPKTAFPPAPIAAPIPNGRSRPRTSTPCLAQRRGAAPAPRRRARGSAPGPLSRAPVRPAGAARHDGMRPAVRRRCARRPPARPRHDPGRLRRRAAKGLWRTVSGGRAAGGWSASQRSAIPTAERQQSDGRRKRSRNVRKIASSRLGISDAKPSTRPRPRIQRLASVRRRSRQQRTDDPVSE